MFRKGKHADGARTNGRVFNSRDKVVLGIALLLFSVLIADLIFIQVFAAPSLSLQAQSAQERPMDDDTFRGSIFDRNGNLLAVSVEMRQVVADPTEMRNGNCTAEEAALLLSSVLGGDIERYTELLNRDGHYALLEKCIDLDTAAQVRALGIPGIYLVFTTERQYPYGGTAAQIIGGVNSEGNGSGGLEYYYNDTLNNVGGTEYVLYGLNNIPFADGELSNVSTNRGGSIVCSIDIKMQEWLEDFVQRTYDERDADEVSAMIIDAESGEIYATCSTPLVKDSWRKASQEEQVLGTVAEAWEPGSVFKSLVAAAAIDTGTYSAESRFSIPSELVVYDRVITDSHDHGELDYSLSDIIEFSSNIGTVLVARELGNEVLYKYALLFGFGQDAGTDFGYVSDGILRTPDKWSDVDSANIPFGQGLTSSVLQLARAYSVFANGGYLNTPHFLLMSTDEDDARDWPKERIIKQESADTMVGILEKVVSQGTGGAAAIEGYNVAGKTATAQYSEGGSGYYDDQYIYGFAGFIENGDPNFVVVLTVRNPRKGEESVAGDFSEIIDYVAKSYYVKVSD